MFPHGLFAEGEKHPEKGPVGAQCEGAVRGEACPHQASVDGRGRRVCSAPPGRFRDLGSVRLAS